MMGLETFPTFLIKVGQKSEGLNQGQHKDPSARSRSISNTPIWDSIDKTNLVRKYFKVILMLLLPLLFSFPQQLLGQKIQWTDFAELREKLREEPRPLLVFIEADWCKYCAMQKATTFQDKDIAAYVNEHFYSLKLDGESKEEIQFLNRNYGFVPNGRKSGQHELALFLGKENGQLTFPTTVILSEQFQLAGREVGFLDKDKFISLIRRSIEG